MAQIENNSRRNTKIFTGHKNLRVDLTPMVDLGFLLISFFMISTILSQPNVANLVMPKDSVLKTPIHESAVLTLMPAANNKVDYFEGKDPEPATIKHCLYNQVRSIIQQKQNQVMHTYGNKNETVIIIEPGNESSYKNFIDIMDEIQINDVQHYFIIDQK